MYLNADSSDAIPLSLQNILFPEYYVFVEILKTLLSLSLIAESQSWGFTSCSTARVLSIVNFGCQLPHRGDYL